jgi:hypothetical protein
MAIAMSRTMYRKGTNRQPPGTTPPRYPAAGTATMRAGPMNFVTDAPTLPAPKTPSANPCRFCGHQALTQAMPTLNELPAKPTRNA